MAEQENEDLFGDFLSIYRMLFFLVDCNINNIEKK